MNPVLYNLLVGAAILALLVFALKELVTKLVR